MNSAKGGGILHRIDFKKVFFFGFFSQSFNRSASTNTYTSMRIQTFNERHSRDKIENFLKEVETKDGMNKIQLAKAWDEYKSLMKSEKTLAYKYPKQVSKTLKCYYLILKKI